MVIDLTKLKVKDLEKVKEVSEKFEKFTKSVQILQRRLKGVEDALVFSQQKRSAKAVINYVITDEVIKKFNDSWMMVNKLNTWSLKRNLKTVRDFLLSLQK